MPELQIEIALKYKWKKSRLCTHAPRAVEKLKPYNLLCFLNHIRLHHTGWLDLSRLRHWLIRQLSVQHIPFDVVVGYRFCLSHRACRSQREGGRSGSCGAELWSIFSSLIVWLCAVLSLRFTFIFHAAYVRMGVCVFMFVCVPCSAAAAAAHICIPHCPTLWCCVCLS